MTKDIFEDNSPNDNETSISSLADLVGEGKKYKDEQALVKAMVEKDRFIDQLQEETSGLRQDLSQRVNMETFLSRLEAKDREAPKSSEMVTKPSDEEPGTKVDAVKPGMTQEEILEIVNKRIEQEKKQELAQRNMQEVQSTLKRALGNDWKQQVKEKMNAIGVDEETINTMAASKPNLVYAALGIDPTKSRDGRTGTPPSSRVTSTLSTPGQSFETKEYFSELRKTNPKKYWDPHTQQRLFELKKEGKL